MIFWFTMDPIKNVLGSSVYHYYKKQINLNVKLPTKKTKKTFKNEWNGLEEKGNVVFKDSQYLTKALQILQKSWYPKRKWE